ncbi:uncharacterized protein EV420DRAFT_1147723 [Desarmillaria tabescens]|uniref:Uncharacterized protein n=1 Tax=Armillaria tabescens TaxID=1929756 RepID=A0AA39TL62_ARMTA|nr:uncharacterized protein EV420DRAFT_1147723 [Desarmillaria tabescens]KAK0462987.1 hypothetical protein EV420DRAFT_1147723 [Desarmillaria tabescens]
MLKISPYPTAGNLGPSRLPQPFREMNIPTTFGYMLVIRPDPPSIFRQLAYQENSPLPGPEVDPDGWQPLPPALLKGTIYSKIDRPSFNVSPILLNAYATLEGGPFPVSQSSSTLIRKSLICSRHRLAFLCSMRLHRFVTGWKLDLPSYPSIELRDQKITTGGETLCKTRLLRMVDLWSSMGVSTAGRRDQALGRLEVWELQNLGQSQ